MQYNIVGSCSKCGAPIYNQSSGWMSILPPPSIHSCGCFTGGLHINSYTTTRTETYDDLLLRKVFDPTGSTVESAIMKPIWK